MTDWGASGRRDTYSCQLVDPFTLRAEGELEIEPEACSLTWGLYAENGVQGTVTEVNDDFRKMGHDSLVRINHRIEIPGVEPVSETLATLFVDAVQRHSALRVTRRRLSCYSTLWGLSQDYLAEDFARNAGTSTVAAMRDLCADAGRKVKVAPDAVTKETFGQPIVFSLGENRLETLRTVAGWVGCDVSVDAMGYVTIERYVDPLRRKLAHKFVDGDGCEYESGIDWESTRGDPVNRVVAYFTRETKPDDESAAIPLSARVAVDLPDTYGFAYERAGRRRTEVIKVSDACTEDELRERAKRYLLENCGDVTYITIRHPRVPGVEVGSVVDYRNGVDDADPVNVRCIVTEQSIQALGPGCMTTSKMRVLTWRGGGVDYVA